MQLSSLLSTLSYSVVYGSLERDINAIVFDSRKVTKGDLFVAHKGETVDGHNFIGAAIESGASCVLAGSFTAEQKTAAEQYKVTLLQSENPVHDGGILVAASYDFPANKMKMIGVTGTDGKTTTSNMVYHLLKSQGARVGLISTISAKIFDGKEEHEQDTGFHVTTPEVTDVQKFLLEMVSAGCEYAVVESTSHAFAQERLAGINFDVGIVTNITHEHLDYHKSLDRYVLAKSQLFRVDPTVPSKAHSEKVAVLNHDDASWEYLGPYVEGWTVISVGADGLADWNIINYSPNLVGATFTLEKDDVKGEAVESYPVRIPQPGIYNAYNATQAVAAVSQFGFMSMELITSLETLPVLPGRFELVAPASVNHGSVIVDFAHTPHALEEVLMIGRSLAKGRLIVVFGSAGLRDTDKRFLMGKIAAQHADISLVTAEDPRTERVEDINQQIADGFLDIGAEELPFSSIGDLDTEGARKALTEHFPLFIRIPDRDSAILTAVAISETGDVVLVCGKGHEKSMCFGIVETPWSDQESVKRAAEKVG